MEAPRARLFVCISFWQFLLSRLPVCVATSVTLTPISQYELFISIYIHVQLTKSLLCVLSHSILARTLQNRKEKFHGVLHSFWIKKMEARVLLFAQGISLRHITFCYCYTQS